MEALDLAIIAEAWLKLLEFDSMIYLVLGTVIGLIFGVLPGLGGTTALALLIPFSMNMEPGDAIILMAGVMASTPTSGAVTAILLNTPGTAPNAATTLDGYPLAQQGKGGLAIGAAATASGVGGLLGVIFLIAMVPITREIVLMFAPPEFFLLAVLGLVTVSLSTGKKFVKSLMVGLFGVIIASVGYHEVTGEERFTFGVDYLWDGFKLVPVMIGFFAVSEMINLWAKRGTVSKSGDIESVNLKQVLQGCLEPFKQWKITLRGAAIGTGVGALPGVGGTVAAFMAYTFAVTTAKPEDRDSFGKGNIIGVIAPESANNAKEGGALVPTLAFGIPGSAEMAVFLSVLILHGLTPGPTIMTESLDIIWILIAATVVAGVMASVITILSASSIAKLTFVDSRTLVPIVLAFAMIGSYSLDNEIYDVFTTLAFGVIGFIFMRFGFPRISFPLAIVLGPLMETSYFQSLGIGDGTLSLLFDRPQSIIILVLIAGCILYYLKNSVGSSPKGRSKVS
ncbi:tripartite tricarboxylate transporter permease [Litorivicinus sp.]|jgi:putative tricarboxylic transport membrane protein|nr:tripartite tricarboxylate transporter permease [Litorivicinus sp.]MDC1207890.1 tripartite tricarboxylate transporter permease [Litorivicinus sp.]